MANPEQVALIKQSVTLWNQWRQEYIDIIPELSHAHLSDLDLTGIDLSGANLRGANLSWTYLGQADLSWANLTQVNLQEADLSWTNLNQANLSESDLRGVNLRDSDLSFTNLTQVNLSHAQVQGTTFKHSTLTGACLGNWQLDQKTILEDLKVDYVYISRDLNNFPYRTQRKISYKRFPHLIPLAQETITLMQNLEGVKLEMEHFLECLFTPNPLPVDPERFATLKQVVSVPLV